VLLLLEVPLLPMIAVLPAAMAALGLRECPAKLAPVLLLLLV
jgi:hypothetical protein